MHVEALIRTKNKIYDSEKRVVLDARKLNNLLQVSAYEVTGYQKLIFVEKKEFGIRGEIGL
ncbi:hypothetical protein D3C87_2155640 [compost metagenome]